MAYQIGEFSRMTQLSIKTLRYYHEEGLLLPAQVDETSGYRFYDQSSLERAALIRQLRDLAFSIEEIKDILAACSQDQDVVKYIKAKAKDIRQRISQDREIEKRLKLYLEWQPRPASPGITTQVLIKPVPAIPIISLRFCGRYQESGKAFATLFRAAGRHAAGAPFSLYYDQEYKEEADIEVCLPVRQAIRHPGIGYRTLAEGRAISLIHKGSYADLGRSYQRIFDYLQLHPAAIVSPSREHYLKGPGMFFRGNPKKYLTEIQFMLAEQNS